MTWPQQPGQPQQYGYPQQGNQQQGFPQQDYSQQGSPQQGFPQQGYPQQGFPSQAYPEQGYSQQGFPQEGLPQQAYPQQAHPQQGFPSQGFPAPGYPQQGFPQQPYGYSLAPPTYTDWIVRVGSALIDMAPVVGLSLLGLVTPLGPLFALVWVLYNSCYLQGTTGQSIGKKATSTRLVRADGRPGIGFGLALGRQLCHILDGLPLYLGYLAPLWDEKRQTFADKIVGTVVVHAASVPAASPYPQPGFGQPPQQRW